MCPKQTERHPGQTPAGHLSTGGHYRSHCSFCRKTTFPLTVDPKPPRLQHHILWQGVPHANYIEQVQGSCLSKSLRLQGVLWQGFHSPVKLKWLWQLLQVNSPPQVDSRSPRTCGKEFHRHFTGQYSPPRKTAPQADQHHILWQGVPQALGG